MLIGYLSFACAFPFQCVAQSLEQGPIADFYRDKTITIVSGSAAGGGYDLIARVLGKYMTRYVPGHPRFIVQNMPGAASVSATNYVYAVAPKDGTVIGGIQRTIPFQHLFAAQGVRYDATRMQWIGSVAKDFAVVAVWHTAPQRSFSDVLNRETVVGSVGVSGDNDLFPRVLNNTLGTKFKIVGGYPGQSQIVLAMQREEVQGVAHWSWANIETQYAAWLDNGTVRPLLQLSLEASTSPHLKGVPVIMDVARDDQQRGIFKVLMSMLALGRPYFVAPEVPSARVEALRLAFAQTMKDPEFEVEATKTLGDVSPVLGLEMQDMITDIYRTPENVITALRDVMK